MKHIKLFEIYFSGVENKNMNKEFYSMRTKEPYFSESLKKLNDLQQKYYFKTNDVIQEYDIIYIVKDMYDEYSYRFWCFDINWIKKMGYTFKGDILTPEEIEKIDIIENTTKYNL